MLFKHLLISLLFLGNLTVSAQINSLTYASNNNNHNSLVFTQEITYFSSTFSSTEFNKSIALKNERHALEKVGRILTYVGVPLVLIGGILVANADELYYSCVNGECEGDASGAFGVVFLAAGVGLSSTGIVLWTIGKNKR
jgi:hypothetical protein